MSLQPLSHQSISDFLATSTHIPTVPQNFTISRTFIASAIDDNQGFDRNKVITIHLPFFQHLLTALEHASLLLGNLVTMPDLNAAIPDFERLMDCLIEANRNFVASLGAHLAREADKSTQGIRAVLLDDLKTEIMKVWEPVLCAWARKWDPTINNLDADVEPATLIYCSPMAQIVAKDLGRILSIAFEVLIWFHRQWEEDIDTEAAGWRKEKLEGWLTEQVEDSTPE
ncbi:hypothetical protein K505DRAFT_359924 [Melanomma pulvis-pyrius CBS 109.77]|uniref:Uncharacterized protein n=1 Tax=Melanomma pulvis-pyrius CBS 109.77 TaxID=1314802 RepID=A0A6A6XGV7_9PLEO|nr:hypothetical protein K505DRAFT_359924 [Melanomma pulvis-pyrius CBS 109.77]